VLTLRSLGLDALLILEDGPIKHVVVLEALTDEEIAEQLAQVAVIGLVIEAQSAHIVQIRGELLRESLACKHPQCPSKVSNSHFIPTDISNHSSNGISLQCVCAV